MTIVVRGRNLDIPADTLLYTRSTPAFVTRSSPAFSGTTGPGAEGNREYFFPSGLTVPSRGRWLLVATSGYNWGCILISFR